MRICLYDGRVVYEAGVNRLEVVESWGKRRNIMCPLFILAFELGFWSPTLILSNAFILITYHTY